MKIQTAGHVTCTVVPGTSPTGLYAPDGSLNVVVAPGNKPVGAYHPCGAAYVTIGTNDRSRGKYAADGSHNAWFNGSVNELLHP